MSSPSPSPAVSSLTLTSVPSTPQQVPVTGTSLPPGAPIFTYQLLYPESSGVTYSNFSVPVVSYTTPANNAPAIVPSGYSFAGYPPSNSNIPVSSLNFALYLQFGPYVPPASSAGTYSISVTFTATSSASGTVTFTSTSFLTFAPGQSGPSTTTLSANSSSTPGIVIFEQEEELEYYRRDRRHLKRQIKYLWIWIVVLLIVLFIGILWAIWGSMGQSQPMMMEQ